MMYNLAFNSLAESPDLLRPLSSGPGTKSTHSNTSWYVAARGQVLAGLSHLQILSKQPSIPVLRLLLGEAMCCCSFKQSDACYSSLCWLLLYTLV